MKQESNSQKTMKDTDGWLHPAVDGQSLGERRNMKATVRRQWKTLMKGYILQWMGKALMADGMATLRQGLPNQTCCLPQSQYTDTGPASTSIDPLTPGVWLGSSKGRKKLNHCHDSTGELSPCLPVQRQTSYH